MKRAIRIGQFSEAEYAASAAIPLPWSHSICLQCRRRAATAIQSQRRVTCQSLTRRRYASDSIGNRLSSKLWGSKSKETPQERPTEATQELEEEVHGGEENEPSYTVDPHDKSADYIPASSALGLPHSSDLVQKEQKESAPQPRYKRFMSENRLISTGINAAVHRALVEVYTLRDAGQPTAVKAAPEDDRGLESMKHTKFSRDEKGHVIIEWDDVEMRGRFVQALTTPYTPIDQSDTQQYEPEDEETLVQGRESITDHGNSEESRSWDHPTALPNYLFESENHESLGPPDKLEAASADAKTTGMPPDYSAEAEKEPMMNEKLIGTSQSVSGDLDELRKIRFDGSDIKFAIMKRVMQLTGIRIPDPAIQDIKDVKTLLSALHEKPKSKKLAQILTVNEQLQNLPNVQLKETRYTPVDKEKETGRWKIIVEELKRRDLPVLGRQPPSEVEEMLQYETDTKKIGNLQQQLNG